MSKYKITVVIKTNDITVSLYERIAIIEISEGYVVSYKSGYEIFERFMSMIGDKPWIYISNRVNSYSLNPTDYIHLNNIPTLKGIGVIQYKKSKSTVLELEKIFIKKPLKTFTALDDAIDWGLEIINKNATL